MHALQGVLTAAQPSSFWQAMGSDLSKEPDEETEILPNHLRALLELKT